MERRERIFVRTISYSRLPFGSDPPNPKLFRYLLTYDQPDRQPAFIWSPGDNATALAANKLGNELRNELALTSGYPELSVILNYARGDEKIEQIYGKDKLPRLARLKRTWDPHNVFAYNHPLPLQYP